MKLSSPIYVLKSRAKKLKKEENLSMSDALNRVAKDEGYNSWSLLVSKSSELLPDRYDELLDFFNSGDLVLLGAKPTVGKISFAIGLFLQSILKKDRMSFFFSLSEARGEIENRVKLMGPSLSHKPDRFEFNYSNEISSSYIIEKTEKRIEEGSLIVVDYLQLLDQSRAKPPIELQVKELKDYAKKQKCIILFISQLNRHLRSEPNKRPTVTDINLPNPLDLKLMNKILFLHSIGRTEKVEVFLERQNHTFLVGCNRKNVQFYDLKENQTTERTSSDKVLENFFIEGKLTHIPVKRGKRRVILEHILKQFSKERKYSETEVNQIIQDFCDDYCTLRREMICEKLMDRLDGEYWVV